MTAEEKQQRELDKKAIVYTVMYGFISHPRYKDMMAQLSTRQYVDMVEKQVERSVVWIVQCFEEEQLLLCTERFNHSTVHTVLLQLGQKYSEYVTQYGEVMDTFLARIHFEAILKNEEQRQSKEQQK